MVRILMPSSPTARTARRKASTPRRWPSLRGRPRSAAQRPLPSMMMATWRGGSKPESGTGASRALGETEASSMLFSECRGPGSNRHDFFFFAGKGLIDFADDLIRRLLDLAGHAGVIVLADLAVFFELLQQIERV